VKIEVNVKTLDHFSQNQDIGSIDLLKIDTEGMEFKVLKGAESLLISGAIRVIQFEYGYACIDAGYLLKDLYDYLTSYGYLIGKLYPNYIDFRPYDRTMENFIGPNFVAVSRKEKKILKQLGFVS
jgi:hypothetical protein